MKRQLMTGLFAALAFTAVAQSNEWRDPEVNAVNRAPMHANFFAYETAEVAAKDAKEQSQNFMTLNGPWKFFWVKRTLTLVLPISGGPITTTKDGTICLCPVYGN